MIFSNKHKIIFLDPKSDAFIVQEKVNVILSPSLYWVKKITLPVNSLREVNRLLPSIFEETLPEGKYSYSAYKGSNESEFYIFAYEDKKILDVLDEKNVAIANVANVYFAQSELLNIDGAMKINEAQSVYLKDDILVLVPCCWIEEKSELDLSSVVLSNHNIALQQFGHIVDIKSLYKMGAVLVVLMLLVFSELFITSQKTNNIQNSKEELFAKNGLKPTMLQNKAMLKKYKSIHVKQTKLRESLSALLSLRLKRDEKISLISLKNRVLVANLSGIRKNSFSHITSALKAKKVNFKSSYKSGTLHLEIAL